MLTWSLASTAIVVCAVGAMLAWYERTRPSARTIALVATMAALAVVGRIAFAPLPNVKPTTDIVLLAGFAFGVVPGFAVGAVTALVSNLFFGQGIHTPWQMLAWGGVGVLGALCAPLLGRVPGRIRLAAICAFAGLAFGAFMDFSTWATLSGRHTLEEYGAIAARSLPFNIAHAVGNALFAAAFGSLVIAALMRARRRNEARILPPGRRLAVPAAGLAAAVLALSGGLAAPEPAAAAATPAEYLLSKQTADGGFGLGDRAAELDTGWAAMAVGASGAPQAAQRRAAAYLRSSGRRFTDAPDLQRLILGLRALGAPAKDAAGRDLPTALIASQRSDGSWTGLTNQTAFGVLALRAAGRSRGAAPVKRAARWLLKAPRPDGGFTLTGRGNSSVDETAAVIQALIAAGHRKHRVTRNALSWLKGRQQRDGGWAISSQTRSNAQSTAWAAQALIAAGTPPERVKRGGRNPIAFLRSLRQPDGHIRYSRASDQTPVWVTAQAQLALAGSPLPVKRRKAARAAAASPPAVAAQRRTARRSPAAAVAAGADPVAALALPESAVRVAVTAVLIVVAVVGLA